MNSLFFPDDWHSAISDVYSDSQLEILLKRVMDGYKGTLCFPPLPLVFRSLELTSFNAVKVVILGQDPYHTEGAAMGLAFSIPEGTKIQPSLRNIFKEFESDLGHSPRTSDLTPWTHRGVLLLNSLLSVEAGRPFSHRALGWEFLTDTIIKSLSDKKENLVFHLWGAPAQSKLPLIDTNRHRVFCLPHPSPLSAYRGFFGSRPFSATNEYLISHGIEPIDWSLN